MERLGILTAGILLIVSIILVVILQTPNLTGLSISNLDQTQKASNSHAWTKAICDKDNFCQDYLIECNGESVSKLSPITGASIQFDKNWQDPRSLKQRERLCE